MNATLTRSLWSQLSGPERAAVVGRPDDSRLAHEFATLLQRELMSSGRQSGDVIGTLPDIRQRYGLGRWACREAVGILELRGWLESRRGSGGGLVLTLPTTQSLVKLMLIHLCLKEGTVDQIIDARRAVYCAVIRNLTTRGNLEPAPDGHRGRPAAARPIPPREGFPHWLAAQTGNRAFSFLMDFVTALYDECVDRKSLAPAAAANTLWAAIRSRSLSSASTALEEFLDATELLQPGESVRLPRMFVREGGSTSGTHAARLAQHLLRQIAEGTRRWLTDLGTEAEFCEQYNLNRDIVRRSIRMLEDIGVVVPRRGRHGGLTSRQPDLASVVELIPPLLWQRRATPHDVDDALLCIKFEVARLAASRIGTGSIDEKAALLEEQLLRATPKYPHELILMENRLIDLAENDVLAACDRGLLFYGPAHPPEDTDPAGPMAATGIANNLKIIEAIRAGDVPTTEAAFVKKLADVHFNKTPAALTESYEFAQAPLS